MQLVTSSGPPREKLWRAGRCLRDVNVAVFEKCVKAKDTSRQSKQYDVISIVK